MTPLDEATNVAILRTTLLGRTLHNSILHLQREDKPKLRKAVTYAYQELLRGNKEPAKELITTPVKETLCT